MASGAGAASRSVSQRAPLGPSPGAGRRWPALAGVALAVLALHAVFFSILSGDDPAPNAALAGVPQRLPVAWHVLALAAPVPPLRTGEGATAPAPRRAAGVGTRRMPTTIAGPPPELSLAGTAAPMPDDPVATAETRAEGDKAPLYPTRPPPAFAYAYDLQRGADRGSLTLRWRPDGEHYEASLSATLADAPWLDLRSSGGFDAAGLAPLRHTDRRRGRSPQAANFQRDGGRVTFSGFETERALAAGAQDRLSWMLQLAAIAAADPALVAPGGQIHMAVVGVRGEADRWTFAHQGDETLALADGSRVRTARLVRLPARAFDTRAEVWLDPARHYLPVRARLSNPPSGRDALQLDWRDALAP